MDHCSTYSTRLAIGFVVESNSAPYGKMDLMNSNFVSSGKRKLAGGQEGQQDALFVMSSTPKLVTFPEIEQITQQSSFDSRLIDAIAQGFVDFCNEKFNVCPIQTIGAPPMAPLAVIGSETSAQDNRDYSAQVCIKSGYMTGDAYFVVKVAAGGHPLPSNTGLMQVFSQSTGRLEALLLDDGVLTELRTAAAGAVAVKFLGPSIVKRIGIVGTGVQARYQLRYLKNVTDCRDVLVWGRSHDKAMVLKAEFEDEWNVSVAETAQELLGSCNVIVTTTSSRQALLDGPILEPLLIVCIGADSVGKQELSTDLVVKADTLVCDSFVQTQERGEFQHVLRENLLTLDRIKQLGEIIESSSCITEDRHLTIFDSSGVAVQDYIVAKMVYESLHGKESSDTQ